MLECLRWGPTSLQTVKRHFSKVFTVCTQLGAGNIKFKYTLLRHLEPTMNCNNCELQQIFPTQTQLTMI